MKIDLKKLFLIIVLLLVPHIAFSGSPVTKTLTVQSRKAMATAKFITVLEMSPVLMPTWENGFLVGWRFEEVPIPPGADIIEAVLEVFCNTRGDADINVVYRGEAADSSSPFSITSHDLINRPKTVASVAETTAYWRIMGWNETPDLASIIQEIVNRPGWLPRNALSIYAVDEGSDDKRSLYMMEKGYGARLTLTYIVSKIEFDTNSDGTPDITMFDSDGDGYFECPIGKTDYTGRLIIDQPVEIMGDQATRVETLFKGSEFVLAEGGEIISDLTSPIVSTAYPELKGNDFQVVVNNSLGIEYGAKILLGGDSAGNWAGDVYLQITRPGADLIIKENSFVSGRHIDLISNGGSMHIRTGSSMLGSSHVKFRADNEGDIRLNRDVSISTSSVDGDCWITFEIDSGDLHMNRNIELSADIVDMCGVNGNIWDDGTVSVVGESLCW